MGKKYIIKLEDNNLAYTAIMIDGVPYIKPLQLLPYTEPDMEQVRKEAYDKGYDDATAEIGSDEQAIAEKAYQRGLSDAWEAARKIVLDEWDNGIKYDDFYELFNGKSCKQVLNTLAAAEVIEKLQAYERAQPAKLRDRLTAFCMKHHCTNCPLNTDDFNCGKGLSFKPCYEGDKDIIPNDELEIYAAAAGLA